MKKNIKISKESADFIERLILREFTQEADYQASQTVPNMEWLNGMIQAMSEINPMMTLALINEKEEYIK